MEVMGIRMLFNEHEPIARGGSRIYLAGVDDAHFYRADDIEKAASGIPKNAFSILLSHTPEVYEQAAAAGFDLMLSGHTHGGQLCLPGGIPIKLEAVCLDQPASTFPSSVRKLQASRHPIRDECVRSLQ